MQGKIVKGISGFYYIHVVGAGIYECKAKGSFRNQKIKPLVGDNVEIAILDENEKKGNIENSAEEKRTDPAGSCQYRRSIGGLCGGKAKAKLPSVRPFFSDDGISAYSGSALF